MLRTPSTGGGAVSARLAAPIAPIGVDMDSPGRASCGHNHTAAADRRAGGAHTDTAGESSSRHGGSHFGYKFDA